MSDQNLREEVLEVLKENKVGTLATVQNNKPHTRYMTFFNEDLTLYTATDKNTHKVEEIERNSNVHILIGYDGEGVGDAYLEIEGTAAVKDDQELKDQLWNDHMKPWFDGPNDPNYIILEIHPSAMTLMNKKDESPKTLKL
ncbi:pyridoxamine 5'-phosphate oxidase family protein [Falsibacillus pallidus]|uniref:pyridoxamine 5'-phosphate oxidase family protein n=1 Tax=Falsibacillus pallidus TaxID=493781 RepID=UPI003D98842A